jgi:hypothetical protein
MGTAADYASHLVETLHHGTELPGMRVQLGNFTIGGKYGLETISEHWGCSATSWRRPAWPRAISARCRSALRDAQHGLADLGPYKFGRLRRWIGAIALPRDSVEADEVEIHPPRRGPFEERHVHLDGTRWAASGTPTSWRWRFARAWYPSLHG